MAEVVGEGFGGAELADCLGVWGGCLVLRFGRGRWVMDRSGVGWNGILGLTAMAMVIRWLVTEKQFLDLVIRGGTTNVLYYLSANSSGSA